MRCYFCFDCLHACSLLFHPASLPLRTSLAKALLSLITTVSPVPRNLVPPLCLCSSAQSVCCLSLCKCVSRSPNFAHHGFLPRLSAVHSIAHLIKHPLPFSIGLSFHERNGRSILTHLTSVSIGWHLRHAHVSFVWTLVYIPPVRLRCNAIRFARWRRQR